MFHRILLVCHGNICRSPMAEALLARRLASRSLSSVVESAGIAARVGEPAHPMSQQLLRERGLDISGHRARQLTPSLASGFDLILVMEEAHLEGLQTLVPSASGKVHRIGEWGDFDVLDPNGPDKVAFERTLAQIEQGLDDLDRALFGQK